MDEVTVRDLRNRGGEVLDRVAGGESLIVTHSGKPIAELRPLRRQPLKASVLLEHLRSLPPIDPTRLRSDLDAVIDPYL